MDNSFPKTIRITKRSHYKWMCYGYDRRKGNLISVDVKKNSLNFSRLGITVTKKFGKSHERNRFKRLVRDSFRRVRHQLMIGVDLVVRPYPSAHGVKADDILDELLLLVGTNGSRSTPSRSPRTES